MKEKLRKTGIGLIGNVPWGTHFCQFYQTREDLADILIPYFKAGLENNEFCMWVTSGPLDEKEAKNAMKRAVPHFDQYLKRGQIEIIPHTEWYLKGGTFKQQKVLDSWIDKLNQALTKGYDGMRVTGNTAWLEKRDWEKFTDYEEAINRTIGEHRMVAICTYWLDKCGAFEVIDVVSNHQFALIRRDGKWKSIESSERKQAEEEIKKFKAIADKAGYGVGISDLEGNLLYLNQSFAQMHGYATDELLGKNLSILHNEEQLKNVNRLIELLSLESSYVAEEVWHKRKDDTIFPTLMNGTLIKDGKGTPLFMAATAIDITERKNHEIQLRESQKKYQALVETTSDFIWEMNLNGVYTYCSPQMEKLWGLKPEEMLGKTPFDLLPPEDRDRAIKAFSALSESSSPFENMEARSFDGTGRVRFLEINGVPFFDDAGKKCGYRGITRDITERRKAEEALRESEQQYRTIGETIPYGVWLTDATGYCTYVSESFLEMVDMTMEQVQKFGWLHLLPPEDVEPTKEHWLHCVQTGEHFEREHRFRAKDGNFRNVLAIGRPIKDDTGKIAKWVGLNLDITERKQTEEELDKSRTKLRNLAVHLQSRREQELSKIAGDIHDDLAQSLTALKMDMTFLSRKMPEGRKDLSDKLKSMIDLTDDTIQTTRNLCAELRPSVLDDLGLAEAVRWYAADFSKRSRIQCDVSIVPEDFRTDKDRSTVVFRIFQETLTNVALHAEATLVKVELRTASGNLELEVKDNGKGITRKQLTDPKSFGLLGIRERIKAFGGEDRIIGVPGQGTVIKVRIPLLAEN